MHQGARLVFFENRMKLMQVANIAFLEGSPFHRPIVTATQIIVRDRHVALCRERFAGVAPNVASTARHEYVHLVFRCELGLGGTGSDRFCLRPSVMQPRTSPRLGRAAGKHPWLASALFFLGRQATSVSYCRAYARGCACGMIRWVF